MKNIFRFLYSKEANSKADVSNNGTQAKKDKKIDYTNAEVTPGKLFEHYKDVLIRPNEILDKLKE